MTYDDFILSLGNRLDKFSFDTVVNPIYAEVAKRMAKTLQIEAEDEQKRQLQRDKKALESFVFGDEHTNDVLRLVQEMAVETVLFAQNEQAQAYKKLGKPIPPAPIDLVPKTVKQVQERMEEITGANVPASKMEQAAREVLQKPIEKIEPTAPPKPAEPSKPPAKPIEQEQPAEPPKEPYKPPNEPTRDRGYTPSSALKAIDSKGVERPIPDWYQKELDKAIEFVRTGKKSYNEALKDTIQTMVDGGIVFVGYENGKKIRRTVAGVVRLNIITAMTELAGNTTLRDIIDLKPPYVDVSMHMGARTDGSQSIVDHMFWQGKRYSLSKEFWKKYGDGEQGTNGKSEYPDFLKVTGYKQAGGLHSFNCRHSFKAGWDFTKLPYTDEEREEHQNKERAKTEYEWVDNLGRRHKRGFTLREALDRQREIERQMRKSLSMGLSMEEAGNQKGYGEARSLYYTQLKEYKRFSEAMGIKPQMDRVYTAYPGGFHDFMGKWDGRFQASMKSAEIDRFEVISKNDSLQSKVTQVAIEQEWKAISPEHRAIAEQGISKVVIDEVARYSKYSFEEKRINVHATAGKGVFTHEVGHAVARIKNLYNDPKFYKILENSVGSEYNPIYDKHLLYSTKSGGIIEVLNCNPDKFVSIYQRRIYEVDEFGNEIFDHKNEEVNYRVLRDFFSEGFREYYMNPKNLRSINRDLYEYIKGVI